MLKRLTRLISVLGVAAMAGTGALVAATPAYADSPATDPPILISDRTDSTFATVEIFSLDPFVRMEALRGGADQQWRLRPAPGHPLVRIVSEATGNCVQPSAATDPTGSFAVQRPCGWAGANVWRIADSEIDDLVRVVNVSSGACLTHPSPATSDNRLRVASCVPASILTDQLFRFTPVTP